jgi:hypothetical protein
MGPEVGRHVIQRLEQPGEDPRDRADQGIGRIRDIEMHCSVIGVHRHFDGVAHVVAQPRRRRRVREPVGDRIAIQEPDNAPRRRDHHVGVIVVPEERGDLLDPFPDVPVEIDVRLLLVNLVWRNLIALDQARVRHTSQQRHSDQRGEAPQKGTPAPETNRDEAQESDQAGEDYQRLQDGELGVDVSIPGPKATPR